MPERAPRTGAAAVSGPSGAAARPAARPAASKSAPAKAAAAKSTPAKGAAEKAPAKAVAETAEPARAGARKATSGATAPQVAVRSGESPWTAQELEEIRSGLDGEFHRIEVEVESLQTAIADVLRDSGDGAGDDQADTGSKAFEREQEMTLLANTRETLFQTERALGRIEDGTYGTCESCGEAIGKARLQAFPRATLCVACKQRQERR